MTRDKKIFAPVLRTYKEDISKRWRVEYWAPTYKGQSAERVVLYGNINKGETIEERYRFADELIRSLNLGKPAEKPKNILQQIIELCAIYWRPKTVSAYSTVQTAFTAFLGKIDPKDATLDTVNRFLLSLHKKGTSSNTIEKYRFLLFTLYSKCVVQKLADHNPVQLVQKIKRDPKSLYFFSDAQIAAFKSAEKPAQLWLAVQLLAYCFIRPGEQRMLRISDINFEYGFIEVRGEVSKNKKTQKVAIPHHFMAELEHLKDYPNNFYVLSKSGGPGIVPISTKWLNDEHAKVLDILKIRGRYAFYSWKHTGAILAVRAGINLKDLQMQMRHHSLDMLNEYLKNLGVMMSEDLRTKYPVL